MRQRLPLLLALLATVSCTAPRSGELATPPEPASGGTRSIDDGAFGVLVMAHGGSEEWNRQVAEAVAPLASEVPTRLAYGMADPRTLQAALDSLSDDGVTRVAVVRMFLSGRSFLDQTEYFLGLSPTPPAAFVLMDHGNSHAGAHHAGPSPDPRPIDHGLTIATHAPGMLDSPETAAIMRARALEVSRSPATESVLLLAHGMGDDAENDEVLAAVRGIGRGVEAEGFARVEVATLREDWETARAAAEEEIRAFVGAESAEGRRVLVLPVRLSGFGPYAAVLDGLDYLPAEGLLPHPAVTDWLRSTAQAVACAHGWNEGADRCRVFVQEPPVAVR